MTDREHIPPQRTPEQKASASRPYVKICGIRTVEALRRAAELSVDYIGLVFAPSKRRVEPEQAAELIRELKRTETPGDPDHGAKPAGTKIVGVFVNPEIDELKRVLAVVPLDIVQLHGQESPERCREVRGAFGVEVFKAISIGGQGGEENHAERAEKIASAYAGAADALLIDTYDPLYGGGSGKTFNWDIVPLYLEAAGARGLKLFVAGGLTPDNAGELVRNYGPDGIDVSSGVETDGHKDIEKMTLFVERAVFS
ncbi:phosphoribosylanthranilate isomerase [Saccharibacillus alkalitolerans]|uniref:N-(5'-phosphoribosyl)anthranilate isomerase n=1 Tax=Saccharibacillus alkalitolerans TaxID=2705290 RepID=A0ABX0F037_9BACL|nr:phosphoribosylanthranilate isomerase [Saccharibacillus alkalitolerans]NGZ74251.1 phosphoribosylanthranilate isomerase [Saccharibacillus alkalitolerans]